MSRPYQFTDDNEKVTSPFDNRAQQQNPAGQPLSFKTNVNRAKTKKWVDAKSVSYGGDDWDGYDEDDEYGVQSAVEEHAEAAGPPQQRSVTTPVSTTVNVPKQRRLSFDKGEERRAFSATQPVPSKPLSPAPPLRVDTSTSSGEAKPASGLGQAQSNARQASAASYAPSSSSDNTNNPEHRRDFSPTAMPPPLKTVSATTSGSAVSQAGSSSSARDAKSPESAQPTFRRPSDIYKAWQEQEEHERRSLGSSHSDRTASPGQPRAETPSQGAGQSRVLDSRAAPAYRLGAPLATVAERKSEYGPPILSAPSTDSKKPASSALAPLSDVETGFWDSHASQIRPEVPSKDAAPAHSSQTDLQHQSSTGFRSLVHQAFDSPGDVAKQGSVRSQAPSEDSGMTRSDTSGTAGISPILSRFPSATPSAVKRQDQRAADSAIQEEPEDRGRSHIAFADGKAVDLKPGYRRELTPPHKGNTPARSPAVGSSKTSQDPVAADVDAGLDLTAHQGSLPATTTADSARAPTAGSDTTTADEPRDIPPEASTKIKREESPSKGRVADLASRFGAGADARRNSTHSNGSKESSSRPNSRPTTRPSSANGIQEVTKAPTSNRPVAEREASFRPKLPGGFESYTSTLPSGSRDNSPGKAPLVEAKALGSEEEVKPAKVAGDSPQARGGALAALAAAGAAVGAAISSSIGTDKADNDDEPPKTAARVAGDIVARPLSPDRSESSTSTIPPTPLAKDDPAEAKGSSAPPRLLHRETIESTDSRPDDFESDRIRKEIARSLSPEPNAEAARAAEAPPVHTKNQKSEHTMSEYEGYWAHSDDDEPPKMSATALPAFTGAPLSPRKPESELPPALPMKEPLRGGVDAPIAVPASAPSTDTSTARPGFLNQRFSWEATPADSPVKETPPQPLPGDQPRSGSNRPSNSFINTLRPPDPLSINPKLSSEHLQIRNAEPGELPSPVAENAARDAIRDISPQPALSEVSPVGEASGGPRPFSGLNSQEQRTPFDPRPPSFREILAIKDTHARIAKYDETRSTFVAMDTGLDGWLRSQIAANPQLRDVAAAALQPSISSGAVSPVGVRHKAQASLSKVFLPNNSAGSGSADPGADFKPSPLSEHRSSSSGIKGMDILSKAGVLGGKGMSKGKGLLAKGKSRFRGGEKDDFPEPSSPSDFPSSSRPCTPISCILPQDEDDVPDLTWSPCSPPARESPAASITTPPPYSLHSYMSTNALTPLNSETKKHEDPDAPPLIVDYFSFVPNMELTVMTLQFFTRSKGDSASPKASSKDSKRPKMSNEKEKENGLPTSNSIRPSTPSTTGRYTASKTKLSNGNSQDIPPLPRLATGSRASSAIVGPEIDDSQRSSGIESAADNRSRMTLLQSPEIYDKRGNISPRSSRPGLSVNGADDSFKGNSHLHVVSLIAPEDATAGSHGDVSPVSPVEEEDVLTNGPEASRLVAAAARENSGAGSLAVRPGPSPLNGARTASYTSMLSEDSDPERPGVITMAAGQDRFLPGQSLPNLSLPTISPMLDLAERRPGTPEAKGKGKERAADPAPNTSMPTLPQTKHLRFDSTSLKPKKKEAKTKKRKDRKEKKEKKDKKERKDKKEKKSKDEEKHAKRQAKGKEKDDDVELVRPQDNDAFRRQSELAAAHRSQRHIYMEQRAAASQQLKPILKQDKAGGPGPESGSLSGLHRPDSSYDRMATIANAHRMLREGFDGSYSGDRTPPDLVASETAARMHIKPESESGNEVQGGKFPFAMSGAIRPAKISPVEDAPSVESLEGSFSNAFIASVERLGRSLETTEGSRQQQRGFSKSRASTGSMNLVAAKESDVPRDASTSREASASQLPSQGNSWLEDDVSSDESPLAQGPPDVPTRSTSLAQIAKSPSVVLSATSPAISPLKARDTVSPEAKPETLILFPKILAPELRKTPTSQTKKGTAANNSFDNRKYKPPRPVLERPMSFVPLERDSRGLPVVEKISTRKHPSANSEGYEDAIGGASSSQEEWKESRSSDTKKHGDRPAKPTVVPPGDVADEDDDLYKLPTPKIKQKTASLKMEPPTRNHSISPLYANPLQMHQPTRLYDDSLSRGSSLGSATQSHRTVLGPDASPLVPQLAGQAPPKKGFLSKLRGKSGASSPTASHSNEISLYTTPSSSADPRSSTVTNSSALSGQESEIEASKRKRASGFFSKSKSPTSPHSPESEASSSRSQARLNRSSNEQNSGGPTPTDVEAEKKSRRKSLVEMFNRNGPPNAPPLPKSSTIIHRVPENPNLPAWQARTALHNDQRMLDVSVGMKAPAGGYYAPVSPKRTNPPSFEYVAGASGMAAIPQQVASPKEKRTLSLHTNGIFGRRKGEEGGVNGSEASPGKEGKKRLRKGPKMHSISETPVMQHQERPWAITIPGGSEDTEEDREIQRREILHASSARWQRGADGQLYTLQDQLSPASTDQSRSDGSYTITPTSPMFKVGPQPRPGKPVFSHLPSEQLPKQVGEQYRHGPASPPPPMTTVIPPLPQGDIPLKQPQPRRTSWQPNLGDHRLDDGYKPLAASRSATTTASSSSRYPLHSADSQTRSDPPRQASPDAARPSLDKARPTVESRHNSSASARTSDRLGDVKKGETETSRPNSLSSLSHRTFIAALEEQRRVHGDHSAMGYASSRTRRKASQQQLRLDVPQSTSSTPPQEIFKGRPEGESAATGAGNASRGETHGRPEEEDDEPVMRATSYPGDEWMPEFFVD